MFIFVGFTLFRTFFQSATQTILSVVPTCAKDMHTGPESFIQHLICYKQDLTPRAAQNCLDLT